MAIIRLSEIILVLLKRKTDFLLTFFLTFFIGFGSGRFLLSYRVTLTGTLKLLRNA